MVSRVLSLLLVVLALVSARPAAQQFVLSSADRARLIAVDFSVVGTDGQPVRDLRPDEVTLKIDGKTRAIRALEFVSSANAPRRVPAPFGTNAFEADGRAVVLVIDDETLKPGREQELRSEVLAFMNTLGGNDRVALVTLPYGGLKADFTTDHSRVMTALGKITGRAPQNETPHDAGCRTRSALVALAGTLDSLATADAPVTVVYFESHLIVPRTMAGITNSNVDGNMMFNPIGTCEVKTEHYQQVANAVARSRAQLYIVIPDLSPDNSGRPGLEHLTGVTGAIILNMQGNENRALPRIAAETSGYYLARIEPDATESAETVRGYKVEVKRPGTVVRQRPQLQARPPASRAPNMAVTTPLDMMREARTFTDLPLRVTAAASRGPNGTLRILTLFDAPGATSLTAAMVGLFDTTGRMVGSATLTAAELTPSVPGAPIAAALTAPPGEYRLRVAATEAPGRAGAADIELIAGLTDAGPLKMSALLVGLSREGGFQPRLEFSTEATALAYLELYGGAEGMAVGVAFEVASSLNGPAIVTLPGAFAGTSEPDKFLVTAAIPVGALPAGDYVVRAIVAAKDQPAGRVVRTIRKVAVSK
jgi:VWFA-related protein